MTSGGKLLSLLEDIRIFGGFLWDISKNKEHLMLFEVYATARKADFFPSPVPQTEYLWNAGYSHIS